MSVLFQLDPGALRLACAVFAVVISLWAFVPYIRYTLFGQTRPQRASWFIWTVLSSIGFASQAFEGPTLSLGFAAGRLWAPARCLCCPCAMAAARF